MTDSRIRRRTLTYADGDWEAEGSVSRAADASRPRPGILVAHDWSGVNEHTLAAADRFAALGYVGIAVDVYGRGRRGDLLGDNSHLMAPLLEDRSLLRRRLLAAVAAARDLDGVDADRLAAVGPCFGGLCALDIARNSPAGLRCAISFHGLLTAPDYPLPQPIAPRLLILHGWADPMAPPADVVTELGALSDAGATWEMHAYAHALHAFTFAGANRPDLGIAHHPLADRRSWQAATAFLEDCLNERD